MSDDFGTSDIAIVGMACRFPGARNPHEFWQNIRDGKESLTELTEEELVAAGVPQEVITDPHYVKSCMPLENMEMFDAAFFGLSPLDARIMDPQHRHFLEVCWEAFEDSGTDPDRFDGSIAVYAGSGHNAYMPYNLLTNPELINEHGLFLVRHTGNDKDFLATRASYCFNLKGPSVTVQTACSTSLVAVHMSVQSLLNNECDMAVAGGVTIELPHRQGYLFRDREILSPDGHCRPFSAASNGTVFGSGVGVVILMRLEDALENNKIIHAVVKSTALNNDGSGKVSYLAPSVDGQAAAILEALEVGDIDPRSVSYIECHGTGTPVGDPIEVAALVQAYDVGADERQYCGIGSVKSNIGHTDNAAGVASLIKVIQSIKHKELAPTLHCEETNEVIDFPSTPFYVVNQLEEWKSGGPRTAAISSLGVGGTNAHVIIEEAPPRPESEVTREWQLLILSARTEIAVENATRKLAEHLEDNPSESIADVAYTLQLGRQNFDKRRFAVVRNIEDAVNVLDGGVPDRLVTSDVMGDNKDIVFMFAGGGAQYPDMGRGLYDSEPVYRQAIDDCLHFLEDLIPYHLKELLYPDAAGFENAKTELQRPSRSLPALFVTQYAQAKLWMSWGVTPTAMVGHSMGENTAACLSGVISLKDALGLVSLRGALFETVPEGGMLSVQLDESELLPFLTKEALGTEIDIASVNSTGMTVASGPRIPLDLLEQELNRKEIPCQRVHINIAAHSRMVEPILGQFREYLQSIELNDPTIPFLSNRTGTWIGDDEATDPEYWVAHLRNTVRFSECAETLLKDNKFVMLEVGPGRTLSGLVDVHELRIRDHAVLWSMRHPDQVAEDLPYMLGTLGQIWQGNGPIDWQVHHGQARRHLVTLPTYAFDHARHWVEPGHTVYSGGSIAGNLPERKTELADFLYQSVWHRSAPGRRAQEAVTVLLIEGGDSYSRLVTAALNKSNCGLIRVSTGKKFEKIGDSEYCLRLDNPDDFVHLISDLTQTQRIFTHILYLPALDAQGIGVDVLQMRSAVFDGVLFLAQAIGGEDVEQDIQWLTVTRGLQQVSGEAVDNPMQALVLGPSRVIPREFPTISCTVVDIESGADEPGVFHVLDELLTQGKSEVVAYRGNARFVQAVAPLPAPELESDEASTLVKGDTVLITGGLGALGLVAARELSDMAQINIVLLTRSPFPEREYWNILVEREAPEASLITEILHIESSGSRVEIVACDVSDLQKLESIRSKINEEFGELDGIVHTAGVVDDSLIQLKDMDDAQHVLAPKVSGSLHLSMVFPLEKLKFCILYSSTSSLLGLAGQVDYTAANAFLDSFALHQHSLNRKNIISVNWHAWKEVGMAARLVGGEQTLKLPAGRPTDHPFLDRCIVETDQETGYSTLFNVADYWVLDEHRLRDGGTSLMPGSGFIEIIRAAYQEARGSGEIIVKDVDLLLPFVIGDNEKKELRVMLEHGEKESSFRIMSQSGSDWLDHVTGTILAGSHKALQSDIKGLIQKCDLAEQHFTDPDHHPHLLFGDRWSCLKKVSIGTEEAVIELMVEDRYLEELESFPLHPALLDMAVAGAQVIIPDYDAVGDFYVPVSYGSLSLGGRFAAKSYSHVVYRAGDSDEETAMFDINVFDENGVCSLRVERFCLRKLDQNRSISRATAIEVQEADPALEERLELGLSVKEGAMVLRQLVNRIPAPQIVVTAFDYSALQESAQDQLDSNNPVEKIEHDPDVDPDIPEVERVLAEHTAIADLVVRSYMNEDGSRRLIVHYVPDAALTVTVSDLRRFAKEKLEPENVPQYFLEVDELPRDDDGCVDRKSLLDPYAPEDTYIAPRTSVEKVLARIWQDVLGVDRIGITDNFYDVGGHSLLSIRVIVRVEKKVGVRLDQAKMALSTLEQLAREIDDATWESAESNGGSDHSSESASGTGQQKEEKKMSKIRTLFRRNK